jgi:protein ImuB
MGAEPHLRARPLAVYAAGRIIAASLQARQAGVQSGWSIARTQALFPDCLLVPHQAATTLAAWDEVLHTLYTLTPCIEAIRPGLALADIRPPEIIKPLLEEWDAHGGVADDRTTAELAALTTEAGKLRVVRSGCSPACLRRIPITALNEVGVRGDTIERLGWFGWHHVGQLRSLTKRQLLAQFEQGELLYRYAQASDTRALATYRQPPIIETHFAFDEAAQEPCEVEPVLDLLVRQACDQLEGRVAQSVTVSLDTSNGPVRRQRLLRDATASVYSLHHAAQDALRSLLRPALAVQRLEVCLGSLAQPRAVQGQLFGSSRPAVRTALEAVEHRFPGALQRFKVVDPAAYLPEEVARLETIDLPPEEPTKRRVSGGRALARRSTSARSLAALA